MIVYERNSIINKNRELKVEIRLNLLAILDKDVALSMPDPAYIR